LPIRKFNRSRSDTAFPGCEIAVGVDVVFAIRAAVFGALATATALERHPDAELLALGRQLGVAKTHMQSLDVPGGVPDEIKDAAMNACFEIVDQIIDLPATMFDALKVKAREGIAETVGNIFSRATKS